MYSGFHVPGGLEDSLQNVSGEITRLLQELKGGHRTAEAALIPLVYKELHRIATVRMRGEAAHHSLQPTVLVHDAYLRLTELREIDWQSRSHFFALAATVMRRILVDHARASRAKKRGRAAITLSLREDILPAPAREPEILALDEALNRLAEMDPRQAKIIELRFFTGMSEEEVATVLGISARTVKRDWRAARAWLFAELKC